ncbi:MAG: curli-like amyloid fiber formation chaperone CsgH [Rhodobacterales bacterium]|nr:curli-like amyloid fiber formation chaperone CsgH [Rhodobacterales bacterium]
MVLRSPLLIVLTALFLAACALSGVVPRPAGDPRGALSCALVVDGTGFEGRLTARETVAGDYAIRLSSGGVSIDQSGEFAARPGEVLLLGSGALGGSAFDVLMRVTAEGRDYPCTVTQP